MIQTEKNALALSEVRDDTRRLPGEAKVADVTGRAGCKQDRQSRRDIQTGETTDGGREM